MGTALTDGHTFLSFSAFCCLRPTLMRVGRSSMDLAFTGPTISIKDYTSKVPERGNWRYLSLIAFLPHSGIRMKSGTA